MPSRTNRRLVGSQGARARGLALVMTAAGLMLLSSTSVRAGFDELEPRERVPAPEKVAVAEKKALEKPTSEKMSDKTSEKMTTPTVTPSGPKAEASERVATPPVASKGPAPLPATQSASVAPLPAAAPPPVPAVKLAPPPPDQSWLQDVPDKPGAKSRGKAAVFVIRGDDYYQPVRAAVVKTLRRRGLNVTANLRPVDSPAQYREMSQTLQLGVFIEGEMRGEGARQTAQIRLRSGVSGRPIATATFTGPTKKIVGEVGQKLWTRMGPAISRNCASASRQRRPVRAPMRIEAGDPEDSPLSMRGI